jgi:geranylgeranyl reductase family protein
MDMYDVIIVGGGPAGLKCAEVLGQTDKRVLLLEKKDHFGEKLCAGGLTAKDLEVLPIPDKVIEHKIARASIHTRHQRVDTPSPTPFLFTVDRQELGAYQGSLLDNLKVEVKMNSQVLEVTDKRVVLKDGSECGYKFLVGADGYASIVRKHLKLPVRKRLIGFQYTIPKHDVEPLLEIYLHARRFNAWYAWIFPHRESIAVGFCCDPRKVNHQKMKQKFQDWLIEKNIDPGIAKMESFPISYDYRGVQFGNIFLVGEAAGLANGLTGEGIYQSLVSGQEVARMILDPQYISQPLKIVLKYNRILHRIKVLFRLAGPLKGLLHELLLILMTRKRIKQKINANFS